MREPEGIKGGRLRGSERGVFVARAQTLPGLLRHKAYRKRTSGRARWHFPGGFQMAVAYYALLQQAARGGPVFLNAASNEPLKVESALICQDTGGACGAWDPSPAHNLCTQAATRLWSPHDHL